MVGNNVLLYYVQQMCGCAGRIRCNYSTLSSFVVSSDTTFFMAFFLISDSIQCSKVNSCAANSDACPSRIVQVEPKVEIEDN